MTKSELEVLKALSDKSELPYRRGRVGARHLRHEKVIDLLKVEGVIYLDSDDILQLGRRSSERRG